MTNLQKAQRRRRRKERIMREELSQVTYATEPKLGKVGGSSELLRTNFNLVQTEIHSLKREINGLKTLAIKLAEKLVDVLDRQ